MVPQPTETIAVARSVHGRRLSPWRCTRWSGCSPSAPRRPSHGPRGPDHGSTRATWERGMVNSTPTDSQDVKSAHHAGPAGSARRRPGDCDAARSPAADRHTCAMDLTLTPAQAELRDRARAYVVDALQPLEAEFERNHTLPDATTRELKRLAIEARLHGGSLPGPRAARDGRRSSRSSSTSSWARRRAACGASSRARTTRSSTARPSSAGGTSTRACAASATAATRSPRPGQGSDARTLASTAVRDAATGEWVLNGEKWFVTGPSDTDFMIFHCHVIEGDERQADAVPRRLRHARPRADRRPRLHAHVRRPPPAVRAARRPGHRRRGARRRGRGGRA